MPLDVFPGNSLFFSFLVPLAGFLFGLGLIYLTIKKISPGPGRSRLYFFHCCCLTAFLVPLLSYLPVPGLWKPFLSRLSFYTLVSLPLAYNLIIPRFPEKLSLSGAAVTLAIIFLLPASFIQPGDFFPSASFIFIPAWLIALARTMELYKESVIPGKISINYNCLITQFVAGWGIILDTLLIPRWQIYPFFSFLGAAWLMYRAYDNRTSGHPRESRGDELGAYISMVILVLLGLWLNRRIVIFTGGHYGANALIRCRACFIVLFAIGGALLHFPLTGLLKSLIRFTRERFMDAFERELSIRRELSAADVSSLLQTYLPGVKYSLFVRRAGWKRLERMDFQHEGSGSPDDYFFTSKIIIDDFKKKNFSIMTPNNQEKYSFPGSFYGKMLKLVEKTDLLFIPVIFNPAAGRADSIILFHRRDKKGFVPSEIRRLRLLAARMAATVLIEYESFLRWKKTIPANIFTVGTREELTDKLTGFLKESLPLERIFLETRDGMANLQMTGSPDDTLMDAASQTIKEPETGKAAQFPAGPIHGEDNGAILKMPIPSVSFPGSFLALVFNQAQFQNDNRLNTELGALAGNLGPILELIGLEDELKSGRDEIDKLTHKASEEKLKMAGEIHDTVAQELYAARMMVELMERRIKKGAPQSTDEIYNLKNTLSDGLEQVRDLIEQLREPDLPIIDKTIDQLIKLTDKINRQALIKTRLDNPELLKSIPVQKAYESAMIAREGINNARKHSNATSIRAAFGKRGSLVSIIIADNGKGFDSTKTNSDVGFGLSGIRKRCERIGGSLKIRTAPGKGTVIKVMFPAD